MPELYNTFLYTKWIVDVDGSMEITDMPIELLLGDNWDYIVYHKRAAVAYSRNAKNEPHNLYWEAARDRKRHCRLRGTVVVFRHHGHVESTDVYPDFHPKRIKCTII